MVVVISDGSSWWWWLMVVVSGSDVGNGRGDGDVNGYQ